MADNGWCDSFARGTGYYILLVDTDRVIGYVNPALASELTTPAEELVGRHVESILAHGSEDWSELVHSADSDMSPLAMSLSLRKADGSIIDASGYVSPWIRDGQIRGLILCLFSNGAFKKVLEKEERTRIANLLDILGHDLTSIHQEVLSTIELAVSEGSLPQTLVQLMNDALDEITRGGKVITNVSKLIQIGSGSAEIVELDLTDKIRQALAEVSSSYGPDAIEMSSLPKIEHYVKGIDQIVDVIRAILTAAVLLNRPNRARVQLAVDENADPDYTVLRFFVPGVSVTPDDFNLLTVEPPVGLNRLAGRLLTLASWVVQQVGGRIDVSNLDSRDVSAGVEFVLHLLKGDVIEEEKDGTD